MLLVRTIAATLAAMVTIWQASTVTAAAPDSDHRPHVDPGRELFERVWEPKESDTGDGLGPLFNERSCVACHALGGVGGGGPNSKNVELLSVDLPKKTFRSAEFDQLERNAAQIHYGLRNGTVLLHTFSTDPRYAMFREQVLGLAPRNRTLKSAAASLFPEARRPPGDEPVRTIVHGGITLKFTQRNSTALFGAGLIDRIPESEIKAIADAQGRGGSTIRGRFVGRFGWRGQTADLADFVKGACTTELGLDIEGIPQAADPIRATVVNRRARQGDQLSPDASTVKRKIVDLNARQVDELVVFVDSLPKPGRRIPVNATEAAVRHGEQVFAAIGCADCHRPTLAAVGGIYSDLLLHSMGPRLTDPHAAPLRTVGVQYYDLSESLADLLSPRNTEEWRTPPLWGLADSAPYLHDGRAATVAEAVEWHGGEAQKSLDQYAALEQSDRDDLHHFLASLVAPDAPELKQPLAPKRQVATGP